MRLYPQRFKTRFTRTADSVLFSGVGDINLRRYEMRLGNRRKSRYCLKSCDGEGCYDEVIMANFSGYGKYKVWASRCKRRLKIGACAIKSFK